ncbi:toprim domain-containing protein [Maribacter sp. ACAM166]|jgi:hypothetical protein|uniref:toprim domain-containing protein n=1 Tax=Maribacter sp. ACAM166 TaxID=2508996 RepID=UPI0010FE49E9|nr:toprim domain-containing protein [Maribacter sp. ACAM166]TLP71189.1 DNA primase [Maribacter sp. ACAM166]
MKRKRTKGLTCERARAFPIERTLAKLGYFPTRTTPKEAWFLSPFRSETQASFKVCKNLNKWYDHGAGKGGNVVDLICLITKSTVKEALQIIGQEEPFFSFQQQPILREEIHINEKVLITKIKTLEHPALLGYLKSRAISIQIAKEYVKEVHYTFKGKPYFAIGLKNGSGGWELRNKYLKNCTSPKDVTHIKNGHQKLTVTEGMFDLLSIVGYIGVLEQESDFLVMNSTIFIQKVTSISEGYATVELYLDNDSNGSSVTKTLMEHRGAKDMSGIYKGHKDMNDWLVMNTENGLGQEAQDVFLWQQKQTCFTPDGRKEEIK